MWPSCFPFSASRVLYIVCLGACVCVFFCGGWTQVLVLVIFGGSMVLILVVLVNGWFRYWSSVRLYWFGPFLWLCGKVLQTEKRLNILFKKN